MTENIPLESLSNWPEAITGGKYVRMLEKYVQGLRKDDSHGNRRLFLDDVVIAHLLAFFNPTLRSLRTIEDFSQTRQAQRHLSVRRLLFCFNGYSTTTAHPSSSAPRPFRVSAGYAEPTFFRLHPIEFARPSTPPNETISFILLKVLGFFALPLTAKIFLRIKV